MIFSRRRKSKESVLVERCDLREWEALTGGMPVQIQDFEGGNIKHVTLMDPTRPANWAGSFRGYTEKGDRCAQEQVGEGAKCSIEIPEESTAFVVRHDFLDESVVNPRVIAPGVAEAKSVSGPLAMKCLSAAGVECDYASTCQYVNSFNNESNRVLTGLVSVGIRHIA